MPLIERKAALKKLLRRKHSRILYLDHVEGDGRVLFVAMDLEGIVCKRKDSPYKVTEKPSRYWIKVKIHDTASLKDVRNCWSSDGAENPFDNILDRVTGSDPSVTDYILESPAKCPNCRREILEKTLIEPA